MGERKEAFMAEAKKMTQTQVIKEIATACELSNKQTKAVLDKYVEIAIRETKKAGLFVLPGIGRLKKVERKARIGRNPATGEKIKIAAKKVVKLTLAKALKDAIVPPKKK
jgi:DNA-binding protein HU-beta